MTIDFGAAQGGTNFLQLVTAGMNMRRAADDQKRQDDARSALTDFLVSDQGPASITSVAMMPTRGPPRQPSVAQVLSSLGQSAVQGSGNSAAPPPNPALQRLMQADPMMAMKAQGEQLKHVTDFTKLQREHLDVARQFNEDALSSLSSAVDPSSYDAALSALEKRYAPLGMDVRSVAPAQFPGADGMQRLLRSAMTARDQIAAADRRFKIDADVYSDQLDDERADRNTDSVIEDRSARRSLVARGQDISSSDRRYGVGVASSDRRYGVGVASSDRRRGQDVADARGRRGQDMTDRRIRETRPSAKPGTAAPVFQKVAKGPNGQTVGWNGTAWVPVK